MHDLCYTFLLIRSRQFEQQKVRPDMIASICRGVLRVLPCAIVAIPCLVACPVAAETEAVAVVQLAATTREAQPPGGATLPKDDAVAGTTREGEASLGLSATKALTYKLGTAVINMVVYSAGVGLVGGTLLTAFNTAQAVALYTANDYLWDTYAPKPVSPDGSFDAEASAWRATEKYLTFKPVVAAIKYASIYALTGSVATMLSVGTISLIATSGVFYVNNFAWDLYEWSKRPVVASPVPPVAAGAGAAPVL
jgi:uncharacterized membrane protein